MRIGIYGGSFNPIHNGHLGVARAALETLALDRLIVIPAARSPFKDDQPASPFDRLLLVRAAFNGWQNVTVDDREITRGGVSYAIDTVREIGAANPGAELFFVLGEDSVEGLQRWKDAATLWSLCTPKAFPRTSESSTEIRRRLAAGESIDDLVPPVVAAFIRHHVRYTGETALATAVLGGLVRKGGYCPCRLPKLAEFFCPCREFQEQLNDPGYHGLCHCRLYEKP